MYDIAKLFARCEKIYQNGDIFRAYIHGTEQFALSIPLQTIKQTTIQHKYDRVSSSVQKLKNSGLPIVYKEYFFKTLGKQTLPYRIVFETLESYLKTVKKEDEYQNFIYMYEQIISKYPQLKELFSQKPFLVLEFGEVWERLLSVVEFLILNPKPNIYTRELPLQRVDTKFVEKYRKILDLLVSTVQNIEPLGTLSNFSFEKKYHLKFPQPLVRFRILDEEYFINGLSDLSLPLQEFSSLHVACENVFIIENKITTLSFANLKNSMVIFGQGYGVGVLKNIPWLQKKNIFYWGDIDLDGYAILSQLRGYYPKTESFLMDLATYEKYKKLGVCYNKKENPKALCNLRESEKDVYAILCKLDANTQFRIEQEIIPFGDVRAKISGMLRISL